MGAQTCVLANNKNAMQTFFHRDCSKSVCACTHIQTGTDTHKNIDYTGFIPNLTDNKQGFLAQEDSRVEQKTRQVYCLGKKKCPEVRFERVQIGFLSEGKEVSPCRGAEDRKGMGTNSGKSGMWNLIYDSK